MIHWIIKIILGALLAAVAIYFIGDNENAMTGMSLVFLALVVAMTFYRIK